MTGSQGMGRLGGPAVGAALVVCLAAPPVRAETAGRGGTTGSVGYRGDGTCVFAGCNPPIDWDEKTGRNILWKVPMPNWGNSCPIVVADRVFVTSEPGWEHDFPLLLCLSADTGRTLWQREVNHLPAVELPPDRRAEIARTWHELLGRYRAAYTLFNEYFYGQDKEAVAERFRRYGFAYRGWKGGGYGQLRSMRHADGDAWRRTQKTLAEAGLDLETWGYECGMGTRAVGQAFPTPVSDGRCVYVVTGFHSFACYDLDGRLRWMRYHHGQFSERGNDYCKNARSPLLYRDLLISDVGNVLRAFHRRTGRLEWSHPFEAHTIATPIVITAGGTDVLLTAGAHAWRLPDGAKLTVQGWSDCGATALRKYDQPDVAFFTGGGEHGGWEGKGNCDTPPPTAVAFSLRGETLVGKVLWSGVNGERVCAHTGLVYHAGRLYHPNGFVLDARSGKVVAGETDRHGRNRATPQTRHLLLIAGGHLYGLRQGRGSETRPAQTGVCEVYTLDGEKVAESELTCAPVEGRKKDQIIQVNGYNTWPWSYGCPFTVSGDRIYVRSADYLYCIGRK